MVPVSKKKTGVFLSADEERLNTILSQARMLSENCIGLLKGRFPLAFKPSREYFPDFKGRKLLYTLTVMIINDHLLRIRYYNTGWPGNVHDERVFRNCDLARNHDD